MPPSKVDGGPIRTVAGSLLIAIGLYVFLACIIHWKQIQHFTYIGPVRDKIVYRNPPVPPEPGYDTGDVVIEDSWETSDKDGKTNGQQTGQYQLETPDGVISLISVCPIGGVYPSLVRGDKVNLRIIPDDKAGCSKFVRARRWQ